MFIGLHHGLTLGRTACGDEAPSNNLSTFFQNIIKNNTYHFWPIFAGGSLFGFYGWPRSGWHHVPFNIETISPVVVGPGAEPISRVLARLESRRKSDRRQMRSLQGFQPRGGPELQFEMWGLEAYRTQCKWKILPSVQWLVLWWSVTYLETKGGGQSQIMYDILYLHLLYDMTYKCCSVNLNVNFFSAILRYRCTGFGWLYSFTGHPKMPSLSSLTAYSLKIVKRKPTKSEYN